MADLTQKEKLRLLRGVDAIATNAHRIAVCLEEIVAQAKLEHEEQKQRDRDNGKTGNK